MARHFRANYLRHLQEYYIGNELQFHGESKRYTSPAEFNTLKEILWKKDWIVYAKKPFAGPKQIIQYLSNYTHRIAISNHRLISCENEKVSFRWRDYADKNKIKVMSLGAEEFIRRYLLHVLPLGFTRLRHIGFLANRYKADKLKKCRTALQFDAKPIIEETVEEILLRAYGVNINRCPHCHIGNKKIVSILLNKYHQSRGLDSS